MAKRIPTSFINELISRVDLIELIGAKVKLKKSGHEYSGLCPFHQEKSPSFTVSPVKQFYHCFGCGAHGNAIDFMMNQGRLGFIEAVEWLANQVGMTLPERVSNEAPGTREKKANWATLLEKLCIDYQQQLSKTSNAMNYFKNRGLSPATIEKFGLGFAPTGWQHVLTAYGKTDADIEALHTLGMVIKKDDGGYYDRFRERVMFPIHSMRGDIIGFGGRAMGEEQPKYLNSPETPLFQKGRELYGLNYLIARKQKPRSILVVEGYMDVIGLSEHGVTNAVATLGTAVTTAHLTKLTRVCSKIAFCFDGDTAGGRAAWRALQAALPLLDREMSLHFVFLPQGEDPDSFISKHGKAAFAEHLKKSSTLATFFFEHLSEGLNLAEFTGKAALAQRALPLIDSMPAGVVKPMMLQALAERVHLPVEELGKLLKAKAPQVLKAQEKPVESALPLPKSTLTPVQSVIALLLQFPELAQGVHSVEFIAKVTDQEYQCLHKLLQLLQGEKVSPAVILEFWRETPLEPWLRHLASWQFLLAEAERKNEFAGAFTRCIQDCLQRQINQLIAKMRAGELNTDQRKVLQAAIQQQKRLQQAKSTVDE